VWHAELDAVFLSLKSAGVAYCKGSKTAEFKYNGHKRKLSLGFKCKGGASVKILVSGAQDYLPEKCADQRRCARRFIRWQQIIQSKAGKLKRGLAGKLFGLFNDIKFPPKPWKLEQEESTQARATDIAYDFTSSNADCRIGIKFKVKLCPENANGRRLVFPQPKKKTTTHAFGCNCPSLHSVSFVAKITRMKSRSRNIQVRCLKKHLALSTGLQRFLQTRAIPKTLLTPSQGSDLNTWLKYNVWMMGPQVIKACNAPKDKLMALQKALSQRANKVQAEAAAKAAADANAEKAKQAEVAATLKRAAMELAKRMERDQKAKAQEGERIEKDQAKRIAAEKKGVALKAVQRAKQKEIAIGKAAKHGKTRAGQKAAKEKTEKAKAALEAKAAKEKAEKTQAQQEAKAKQEAKATEKTKNAKEKTEKDKIKTEKDKSKTEKDNARSRPTPKVNKPQGAAQVKKALFSSVAKNMNIDVQKVEAEVDLINDFPDQKHLFERGVL